MGMEGSKYHPETSPMHPTSYTPCEMQRQQGESVLWWSQPSTSISLPTHVGLIDKTLQNTAQSCVKEKVKTEVFQAAL